MSELKFKSQICTTVEQSKRLLELGLKAETADMHHFKQSGEFSAHLGFFIDTYKNISNWYQPAWSLHRLIEVLDPPFVEFDILSYNPYEDIIYNISECIKNGYINKEYLKQ